jgi:hypothetical protein
VVSCRRKSVCAGRFDGIDPAIVKQHHVSDKYWIILSITTITIIMESLHGNGHRVEATYDVHSIRN